MKKRYTEEQIIGFLREADAGLGINELCRKYGFSQGSNYAWKAKFGGMNVSEAQRLKAFESENSKLKRLLANAMLEVDAMRKVLGESSGHGGQTPMCTAIAKRGLKSTQSLLLAEYEHQCNMYWRDTASRDAVAMALQS